MNIADDSHGPDPTASSSLVSSATSPAPATSGAARGVPGPQTPFNRICTQDYVQLVPPGTGTPQSNLTLRVPVPPSKKILAARRLPATAESCYTAGTVLPGYFLQSRKQTTTSSVATSQLTIWTFTELVPVWQDQVHVPLYHPRGLEAGKSRAAAPTQIIMVTAATRQRPSCNTTS